MEKIKCPNCGMTLIYADNIKAEIKCNRCKKIIRLEKERANEHCKSRVI